MHRGDRAAHVLTDQRRLARAQRPAGQHVFERLAVHKFHAQRDLILVRLDAQHADHVRIPHPGERPALAQQRLPQPRLGDALVEDLHRDLALEFRVPRPVDAPERTLADLLIEAIPSPPLRRFDRRDNGAVAGVHRQRVGDSGAARRGLAVLAVSKWKLAMSSRTRTQSSHRRSSAEFRLRSSASQSIAARSATWSSAWSMTLSGIEHLAGEPLHGTDDRHARRIGGRLVEDDGQFFVAVLQFEPRDHRFAVAG